MIYTYRMDDTGCGSYRILWPSKALDPDGKRIRHVDPGEHGGIQAKMLHGMVSGITAPPDDMEAIILQRPTSVILVQCIPHLQDAGVRVIVDVDDDLELLSPRHPTWNMLRMLPGHDARAVKLACDMADVVTCSTPAILKRLAPENGVLIRNRLPKCFFGMRLESPALPHVGWPGSIGTHPDDLAAIGNSVARLGIPVRIVGPEHARGKSLLGIEPEFTGPIPFDDWIPAVSTIHTGIAPLEMTGFNQAKSALKALELSVAQVPFVHSPTSEYLLLGAGLVADKPKDWVRQLRRLLHDSSFRQQEVDRNYTIARQHVLEDHLEDWATAWGL